MFAAGYFSGSYFPAGFFGLEAGEQPTEDPVTMGVMPWPNFPRFTPARHHDDDEVLLIQLLQ